MQDTIKDIKEQMQNISFVVHEASEERHPREKKNLVICFTCIVIFLIIALIGTNLAWLIYDKSMETVTETNATAIATPAAIGNFWNVAITTFIDIPCNCCVTVSVENTSDTTAIEVTNANIIFERVA